MVAQLIDLVCCQTRSIWQRVEAAWSTVPQEHIQSLFESMPRRVAAVISNNGGYSGYRFWQVPHFTEVYKFNHLILGFNRRVKAKIIFLDDEVPIDDKTTKLSSRRKSRERVTIPRENSDHLLIKYPNSTEESCWSKPNNCKRVCDLWLQEGMTNRRVRSHLPQCTTSRADRQIVRITVTDRSLSARTIRRRLQQCGLYARHPLLRLTLTQNHRGLHRQWCDERRMWTAERNEIVFTDETRFCLQHHDGRIRVCRQRGERMLNSCVMHRHTGLAPGNMISLSHSSITHCRYFKQPTLHLRGVGANCPFLHGLPIALFQQDNARPHVPRIVLRFFVNRQIQLLLWPARSPELLPIENMWSMVAQRLTHITYPAATPDQLWQRVEAAWSAVPQERIQSLSESMPRRVAEVIFNNGGYSDY
ncbi:hypothetical protein LAZ67_14001462 [Cordylochernes scorpioides]|uniref:Transposable element Tc1 transposase n=1 Tax=Cordylochernes scorpioides TaxID=51811 RepID=A0ABY6L832_9ARAC|nr:hypothetical protein LAZ67_14001462 [Cordylochernes scorpioides]